MLWSRPGRLEWRPGVHGVIERLRRPFRRHPLTRVRTAAAHFGALLYQLIVSP